MNFVLLLWEHDRSGLQQAFGPYPTQDDADAALVDLGNWPSLVGAWEITPLTRHGETTPTTPPAFPYTPVLPACPAPAPQWPYSPIIWCGTVTADAGHPSLPVWTAAPGWNGCAPAAPGVAYTCTWPPRSQDDEEPPPDIAVPARV